MITLLLEDCDERVDAQVGLNSRSGDGAGGLSFVFGWRLRQFQPPSKASSSTIRSLKLVHIDTENL